MISEIEAFFVANYHKKPLLVKAPGRVNLIGEHTDYNLGYVLPAAINKGIYFAIRENKADTIHIETFISAPEKIAFDLSGNHQPYKAFWGNYFKAILQILLYKNYAIKGFDCVFAGNLPIGAGLSSSAALSCGFIYAVSELFNFAIPKEEIALLAQKAEHHIGVQCGLMDQYAVLFGNKNHALWLDCKQLSFKYVPVHIPGYSWVLINSNVKHSLAADTGYNERRASCELVVKEVKKTKNHVRSLRDVSLNDLERIKNNISTKTYLRAYYVLKENERVLQLIAALERKDPFKMGEILFNAHWAMANEYEITTKELDGLVHIAQGLPGILGARMMGGGFGGCTINLVQTKFLKETLAKVLHQYKNQTGITAEAYELQLADGIKVVNNL